MKKKAYLIKEIKGNKILLSFFVFFFFFRYLIKSSSLHKNCTNYKEFITVFESFTWEWKNVLMLSCTKTWCLCFPFLFSSSVMQSFFSSPASSLFGTQQQLTHPPVKSSTLPLRKMLIFQGVAPRHTIVTSSCFISLWDSATAHSPSAKELKLSSIEESCFSGLIVINVLALSCMGSFWFATHPYYSLNPYMYLSVVYFYSERPPLSIVFYSMCGRFL